MLADVAFIYLFIYLGRSAAVQTHTGKAYDRNVGRRMVVVRLNCSRTEVESNANRSCNRRLTGADIRFLAL